MHLIPDELAYCGIYCPACSFRVAWEEDDRRHLTPMPAKYDAFKKGDLSDCACENCKGENDCGPCPMQDCAREKDIVSCADCSAFPCLHILRFEQDGIPHHREAVANLRAIRTQGYEKWFASYASRLFCACGRRQSWYFRCDCSSAR